MSQHIARITAIVTLLATIFLMPITASAQSNNVESLCSRFGLGWPDKRTSHALRGMGGLTTAIRDNIIINPANPASYTVVDSTTFLFDFGLSTGMNMLPEAGKRNTCMVGSSDYATALMPLGKHFVASAGLVPYSTVGYRYDTKVSVPGVQDHYAAHAYKGEGNLQEVYLGFAWRSLPYWSLGVNASYLLGNIQHERRITYDIKESLDPTFLDHLRIRSVGVRIGTQGIIPLSAERHQVNIGLIYEPKLPMWNRQLSLQTEIMTGKGAQVIQTDTITSKSLFARPHVLSAGLAYQTENKLIAEADIRYSRWGEAPAMNQSLDYQGADQWQVALDMSWISNERSSSYGQRIAYRAGLQGENAYLRIPNSLGGHNSYYQIGANPGLGLSPVNRCSHMDVTLGYSYLFPSSRTGLMECYLTLGVALRFNEAWFNPIKLD